MATTRATGYVVTAAVWNAVLSGLSDAGVFTGTITTSGTATFSGLVSMTGGAVPRLTAVTSTGEAVRFLGRSSDNVSIAAFRNNADGTTYASLTGASTGLTLDTGSTSRTFTFSGGRVNSSTVQPGFLAYNSVADTSIASGSTLSFDTERFDDGGHFTSGTTFTAPADGRYLITAGVSITNTSGSAGTVSARITMTGGIEYPIGREDNVPNNEVRSFSGAVIIDLDASETVVVTYHGSGTATIGAQSYFSGRLLL